MPGGGGGGGGGGAGMTMVKEGATDGSHGEKEVLIS